jgi:16S rRNA (cytosine1402-N4)-methyltransferase
MKSESKFHVPVLLQQTLKSLEPNPGDIVVDGTIGGGGHAFAIAEKIGKSGTLTGLDLDPAALAEAEQKLASLPNAPRLYLIKSSYKNIDSILKGLGISAVDAILIDIGLSSYDLEGSKRGFSFQRDEILDMRFDPESEPRRKREEPFTARFILNSYSEQDLEKIFRDYSEEPFSKKIAKAIVARRQEIAFERTTDLFELIKRALPGKFRFKAADTARRIFQALRVEVNAELDNLREFLPKAFKTLKPGGRLVVISFHSLEDRIVKQFFVELSKGCICPIDFPKCVCGRKPLAKILYRKPVMADEEEKNYNPRSIPAKLRAIQKL